MARIDSTSDDARLTPGTSWRDRYEYEAKRETETRKSLSEAKLVARVRAGRIEPCFAIWRALGAQGTIDGAALVLWTYLRDHPEKAQTLNRFHCTAALFRILGLDDPDSENDLRKRVQWDHEGEDARQQALLELSALIEKRRITRR